MCIAGMRFPEGGVYLERSLGYGVHAHRPYIHNADLTVYAYYSSYQYVQIIIGLVKH